MRYIMKILIPLFRMKKLTEAKSLPDINQSVDREPRYGAQIFWILVWVSSHRPT